jgi:hypothetical protein
MLRQNRSHRWLMGASMGETRGIGIGIVYPSCEYGYHMMMLDRIRALIWVAPDSIFRTSDSDLSDVTGPRATPQAHGQRDRSILERFARG